MDPYKVRLLDSILGGASLKAGTDTRWELGEVIQYYPGTHTMDVRTINGRTLNSVPRLSEDPKNFTLLKPGTTVVVSYDLPFPIVTGTLLLGGKAQIALGETNITGTDNTGAQDPTARTKGVIDYTTPDTPVDLNPGDKAIVGSLGNILAVLEGGTTIAGAPNAQIRSHTLLGLIETISMIQRNVSSFGEWKIQNDGGRTSFILRAGSNTQTQTGLDEEKWTIKLDLGATGDVFNFEICTPEGQTLFKFHVGSDGHIDIYGQGGIDLTSGQKGSAEHKEDIAGNHIQTIEGSSTKTIKNNETKIIQGAKTEQVATDLSTAIGNDLLSATGRNRVETTGGQLTEIITGGSVSEAKKNRPARKTVLVNGGWEIDLGSPKNGSNISAEQGLKISMYTGSVLFDLLAGGSFRVNTKLPNSIALGGSISSHVVKFEELNQFLDTWGNLIDLRIQAIQSVLGGYWGPTPWQIVQHTTSAFKSVKVGVNL